MKKFVTQSSEKVEIYTYPSVLGGLKQNRLANIVIGIRIAFEQSQIKRILIKIFCYFNRAYQHESRKQAVRDSVG
jgi:hypothetical protein